MLKDQATKSEQSLKRQRFRRPSPLCARRCMKDELMRNTINVLKRVQTISVGRMEAGTERTNISIRFLIRTGVYFHCHIIRRIETIDSQAHHKAVCECVGPRACVEDDGRLAGGDRHRQVVWWGVGKTRAQKEHGLLGNGRV